MQIVARILNTGVFAHKPSTLADGGWRKSAVSVRDATVSCTKSLNKKQFDHCFNRKFRRAIEKWLADLNYVSRLDVNYSRIPIQAMRTLLNQAN